MDLQPVKGTRDFYPEEMRLRNWLFGIWRDTARQFGFEEYDACVLESEELYVRKAGDEITEQLYNFEDKGGRKLALRPEMTPSLARMVLQRKNALALPIKWFSIPQCFRYERMTRGRKREHFQWNADVIGQPGLTAEVEVISLLLMAMQKMGLNETHIRLRLNDRRLLGAVLEHLGIEEAAHAPVMVVMDKRDKISTEALANLLKEQGLNDTQVTGLNHLLGLHTLEELEAELGAIEPIADLRQLMRLLEESGFGGYAAFDISIVRGLSYYTGTVFEIADRAGQLRAICGGGRYDQLLSSFGGEATPMVGFGFGDVVIMELLADLKLTPTLTSGVDVAVLPFGAEQVPTALRLAQALRQKGQRVECDLSLRKLKKTLQRAEGLGAASVYLLLPDELEKGEVVHRDMATRQEERVALASLLP